VERSPKEDLKFLISGDDFSVIMVIIDGNSLLPIYEVLDISGPMQPSCP
jgi:hypothetical protein